MTSNLTPEGTIRRLTAVFNAAVTLSRLFALEVLSETLMVRKLGCSFKFFETIETAVRIEGFLDRFFHKKPSNVHWPRNAHPETTGIVTGRKIQNEKLQLKISETKKVVSFLADDLVRSAQSSAHEDTLSWLLGEPRREDSDLFDPHEDWWKIFGDGDEVDSVRQAVRGPAHVGIDPAFSPGFTLLERNVPMFGETPAELAPYLWCLSIRETAAADTCALSACEYDGLPVSFYRDMAKQCWDEMRHAVGYFKRAQALLTTARDQMDLDDPFRTSIENYLSSGTGLMVPRECNLFEMVANAALHERLVLMNIRVEGPAVARLRTKINSPASTRDLDLKRLFEFDMLDEISHSRMGIYWLKYLVPDRQERRRVIETADSIRAFLLLTAFVHHDEIPLVELISHYLQPRLGLASTAPSRRAGD